MREDVTGVSRTLCRQWWCRAVAQQGTHSLAPVLKAGALDRHISGGGGVAES
jgi:hypothetical protein